MEKTSCPFCNPKQRMLRSNKTAYVLLSDPRKVPGHFLVIPKRHIEKPWDTTSVEIADMFELIMSVQKAITKHLSDGCDVRQNYRPFLKQSKYKVDHIHYHVIPRTFEDEIYTEVEKFETGLFKDLTIEEHERIEAILN